MPFTTYPLISFSVLGIIISIIITILVIRRRRGKLRSSVTDFDVDFDNMDGYEFERFLSKIFNSLGFKVKNVGSGGS